MRIVGWPVEQVIGWCLHDSGLSRWRNDGTFGLDPFLAGVATELNRPVTILRWFAYRYFNIKVLSVVGGMIPML
jgi:hypothetical protein